MSVPAYGRHVIALLSDSMCSGASIRTHVTADHKVQADIMFNAVSLQVLAVASMKTAFWI